jgi:predicted nucleic acid-binding Zn ribbon protein
MPVYTYRREDGTTFDYRQKFLDDPLTVDPETGQQVVRVIQPVGVVFKGSGFYVNDSKSASRSTITGSTKSETSEKTDSVDKSEKSDKLEKAEKPVAADKSEKKAEKVESKPAATPAPAAAD